MMISPDMPLLDAMSVIDSTGRGVAFICEGEFLRATLTDGDVRRHIMRGGSLNISVREIGNRNVKSVPWNLAYTAVKLIEEYLISAVPVIDEQGRLVDVVFRGSIAQPPKPQLNMPVVIQAGGKGTRLYPYTKVLPKPLIPVGDTPITEHIMQAFHEYGCTDFTMLVNHKKNMIKAYFVEQNLPYRIRFLDEDTPLGTGGGLRLLRGIINDTFFMTNCDILVFEDYAEIMRRHRETQNLVTMVCTTQKTTIPYGTVEVNEDGCICSMTEKPSFSFLTNTGFYIIEPAFLDNIPDKTFVHITDLIQACIDRGERVGIYPISADRWADMGQPEELEKMRRRVEAAE
jgi:dTDP-glucose pyrophosphorylase